jgi:hypothetical protein
MMSCESIYSLWLILANRQHPIEGDVISAPGGMHVRPLAFRVKSAAGLDRAEFVSPTTGATRKEGLGNPL